ncbi:hypothetical protein C0585_02215 [Candidatus Woesearchaeota archaeon]|nr:MAG: hypothetical protein C0585_02215 [Candidatus Woesearchaeota archaeon]
MPKQNNNTKPIGKQIKKKLDKGLDNTKEFAKKYTNINTYNKKLFVFETILLVGVIDEFFEGLIMKLDYGIYLNIILLMLSIGILFYFALTFIEKVSKGAIVWLVRLNDNKILRFLVHAVILFILFCMYAKVFYGTNINLVFNIGLNAS